MSLIFNFEKRMEMVSRVLVKLTTDINEVYSGLNITQNIEKVEIPEETYDGIRYPAFKAIFSIKPNQNYGEDIQIAIEAENYARNYLNWVFGNNIAFDVSEYVDGIYNVEFEICGWY
jgi:hypothetical protein